MEYNDFVKEEMLMKGLYIHIPFCQRKCAYCNFISFESGDVPGYVKALQAEIGMAAQDRKEAVDTIFFGGRLQPSVIPAAMISDIMNTIRRQYSVSESAEISIEVNPGTIDREKLAVYRDIGINRISLGLQSADDNELKILGRIHTFRDFEDGYRMARESGFQNINIDLIFGLPNQTAADFIKTLDTVIQFEPEHVSCYALKLEPGTPLYRQYSNAELMPDEDTEREMYHRAIGMLKHAGYTHYETSNFAKPGFACRHNLKYWQGEEYLGFGVCGARVLPFRRGIYTDAEYGEPKHVYKSSQRESAADGGENCAQLSRAERRVCDAALEISERHPI